MADGFDIHLNEDQARRLKAAAEAAGMEPTVYALQALEDVIGDIGVAGVSEYPAVWVAEDEERWAEYERTGVTIPLDDALRDFHANLERRLAEKA
ncbi:hypothetical protein SH203_01214 [Brevundimonas sp. SH203]|uniref:hypothetical protein n=1 Tax=Brevundimonas sp. SH203 TaxID=345167 RepID=UPI0009C64C06|nr:hypothetical protein [Brevundimonas sp. SH203]GAW40814.1 hypothetical protein SH203_01214 [Brevundimonas sp. SH203]